MTIPPSPPAKLPLDLEDVRRKLVQLAAEGRVSELIELVLQLLVQVRDTNNKLSMRLQSALRELYGRKSQKVSSEQLSLLFSELGADAPTGAADAADAGAAQTQPEQGLVPPPPEPPKPPHGRGGRAPLPPSLPRRQHVVVVPAAERVCAQCGGDKKCIGHRTSEVLEFISAHFVVIEEQREKLACPRCPQEGVSTAPSDKVMDRGRPGPGLLAQLLVQKFEDGMPIYRQMQEFARYGVSLAASTLGDWTAFGLDVLAPVAAHIADKVLSSDYLRADDTGMRVLDRDHPKGVKRGHLWGFVSPEHIAFLYAPDWKAKHPAALLDGFSGFLQGDGYAGYAAMLRGDGSRQPIVPDERRLGCGMHIRAKFEKAKDHDARAVVALGYFQKLYRIEATCKELGLSDEARLARRKEQSLPIVDELYRWIHQLHPKLTPRSPLHAATTYALNQEAAWRRCFDDGRFEIDNGEVERQIRRIAVGRKNYLFAGSDKGAERLAIGYTLFAECRRYGVDPLAWTTDVLCKLQEGWPRSRLDELLPDAWANAHAVRAAATEAHAR